jgi:hypothetical protein
MGMLLEEEEQVKFWGDRVSGKKKNSAIYARIV